MIAITHIGASKIQTMVDASRKYGVGVKIVPNLFESKGRSSVSVRDINYEDLLGRSLITIEKEPVEEMFHGKTVLVTGAGGSIGSEISRQLMGYNLKKLVLLDIDETELHDLCLRLQTGMVQRCGSCRVRHKERCKDGEDNVQVQA